MIADKSKVCDPELAFTIGLLKNMGKLILVENAPDETRAIVAVAREYKLSFHAAAREVLDTDDAELGNARLGTQSHLVTQAWQNGAERGMLCRTEHGGREADHGESPPTIPAAEPQCPQLPHLQSNRHAPSLTSISRFRFDIV
jgi:hypothetical protein